jgi:hypothetical protein
MKNSSLVEQREEVKREGSNLKKKPKIKNSLEGILQSPTYAQKLGYDFELPKFEPSNYIQYIDSIIFGQNRKELMMEPIPPECGQMKFCIRRVKSMMNKLAPSY